MGKFRCACVGVGGRGSDHAEWLKARDDVDLIAICDINEKQGKKIAEKMGATYYYDYVEMFEKEKLDAVFTATPHYLHAPVTIAAAEHDINVFCEKPMATTLRDADAMIQATRKYGVKLQIGFQMRFLPTTQYFYNAIRGAKGKNGGLGRITDIYMTARHHREELYYMGSSLVDPKTGVPPGPWRGRWATEGAGILINQAIHNLDILRYICGPFRSLSAYVRTIADEHRFIEVEDTVAVSFELENGAVGSYICASSNKKAEENRLVIHGTDGYIESAGGYAGDSIRKDTRWDNEEDYEVPFYTDPLQTDQIASFFNAIKEDIDPKVTGEEGRKSLEILRGILKSVELESKVHFPLQDIIAFPNVSNINFE